jgi:F-type H+-transporting ATPase subunit b
MKSLPNQLPLAAEGEPNPLLPQTTELIVGIVAFGLLFWVLSKYVFPVFEKTYAERTEKIEGGLQQAEVAQAEAQALLEQYREQLASAREDAARIRSDAQSERQSIVAEARSEAQEAEAAVRRRSEAALAAEAEQVRASLSQDVGRVAVELAEKIVGESLDNDRTAAIVDRFIADLEAGADTVVASPIAGPANAGTAAEPHMSSASAADAPADAADSESR